MMVDLGVRIQQLRMERNMSQSELGKALNRSKSVISAYEMIFVSRRWRFWRKSR